MESKSDHGASKKPFWDPGQLIKLSKESELAPSEPTLGINDASWILKSRPGWGFSRGLALLGLI